MFIPPKENTIDLTMRYTAPAKRIGLTTQGTAARSIKIEKNMSIIPNNLIIIFLEKFS